MITTYEELAQIVEHEKILGVVDATKVADYLTNTSQSYYDIEEEYNNSRQKRLRNLAHVISDESVRCIGTSNDFHNLSVSYARVNMFDCACEILNRGLKVMPYSVDLLADYIKYGLSCGEYKLCEEYFICLQKIPNSQWNWRAYSFSIDYLLDSCKRQTDKENLVRIKKEALDLANEFIKKIGTEQAFFDKAMVYQAFNEPVKEYETLLKCIDLLKVTPKCALRLADIEFDKGNFQAAVKYISRCCNIFRPQPDVSRGYSYLLLALSRISALFSENTDGDNISWKDRKETIIEIYRYFHTALESGLSGIYKNTAETVIRVIVAQTDIEYPYNDSNDPYDF